jgi:hypothetical protein
MLIDDTLYLEMANEAKTDLETRLITVKVPTVTVAWIALTIYAGPGATSGDCVRPTTPNGYVYEATIGGTSGAVEPVWPIIIGNTILDGSVTWTCTDPATMIAYGSDYGVKNITDWEIMDRPTGGVAVYSYILLTITELWAPGGAESNVTTYRSSTTRVLANPTISGTSIRLNVKANTNAGQPVTINNAFIGLRDTGQNIISSSSVQFKFNDLDSISLDPGETVSSDWLTFNFTIGTSYMISIYFEGYVRQFAGGNQWWRNGNFSALEIWGTSGTSRTDTWLAKSVEGLSSASGPGWDSDTLLLSWMDDWPKINTLRTSTPFGTLAMLSALNNSKNILTRKKNLIDDRNPILIHYKIYNIMAEAGPNGSISPSGLVTVNYNENQTFTFTPGGGFSVSQIIVDDVEVPAAPSYTFSNVSANHKIKVYFA